MASPMTSTQNRASLIIGLTAAQELSPNLRHGMLTQVGWAEADRESG